MTNTFSRLSTHKKLKGYFLRRHLTMGDTLQRYDPILFCDIDKDKVFEELAKYERQGVNVYVEDENGERVS